MIAGLDATLESHQVIAVDWVMKKDRAGFGLCAGYCGSGSSIAIEAFCSSKTNRGPERQAK